MARYKLSLLILASTTLILSGCGQERQQNQSDTLHPPTLPKPANTVSTGAASRSVAQPVALKTQNPPPQETELMQKMGLQVDHGRIILDTKKSKEFFEALGKQLKSGVDQSVQKAKQHAPSGSDLGIQVQGEKVVIDLNRTKSFMKGWVETMEILGRELNRSLAPVQP